MDRMTIEGVAAELGLFQKGNIYTGTVQGFPVAVTDAKKAVNCVIQTSIRPKNSAMKKLKELRKANDGYLGKKMTERHAQDLDTLVGVRTRQIQRKLKDVETPTELLPDLE